jgi:ABC-type polysaccharide/polyol phosphate transport system ATPase subunit
VSDEERGVMEPGGIAVDGLSRRFVVHARETHTLKELLVARGRTGAQEVWALRDVSLHVAPGEAVGLVGRNGSGKSTLLRLIAGIIRPTTGTAEAGGRVGSLLELGAGFHPDFTGRENVELNGALQGLPRAAIRERFDEIVAFAELEHAIDRPVRTYSSGMTMRLGFAIAAFLEADVLLLDEVFAVGDESFQRKCFGVISTFKQQGGTILFVSHDASAVERLCDRAVLLRGGEVAYDGPVHEALARYRRALAEDDDAPAASGGLRSEDGEIVDARLVDADGVPRERFLAGEPIALELEVVAPRPLDRPSLHLELRDAAGLLVIDERGALEPLGWPAADGRLPVRLDLPRPPLQFGRFRLAITLLAGDGRVVHRVDDGLPLLVYPDGDGRGLVRVEGTWSSAAKKGTP